MFVHESEQKTVRERHTCVHTSQKFTAELIRDFETPEPTVCCRGRSSSPLCQVLLRTPV